MDPSILELPSFAGRNVVNAVIETPRGSRNKYAYDRATGLFTLRKALPAGMAFPFDFGFVPSTCSGDGDPLDVAVLMEDPVFPGCLVRARLLGVVKATQREGRGKAVRNDRLLAAPKLEGRPLEAKTIDQLEKRVVDEIVSFFETYMELEGKRFELIGVAGPEEARRVVEKLRATPRPPRDTARAPRSRERPSGRSAARA